MYQAFGVRAAPGAGLVEQPDRSFLEQAGADAAQHIFARLPLQDDIVDAVAVKQLPEQQSRGTCANDCYFCPQHPLPAIL